MGEDFNAKTTAGQAKSKANNWGYLQLFHEHVLQMSVS